MKKELELSLVNEYPTFFRDYGGDKRTTCMHYGCTHGNGWYKLLKQLCMKLKVLADADPTIDFHFSQIKEKFGMLTIYSHGGSKEMNELINAYYFLSKSVCEKCGSENKVECKTRGWIIQTLCENCAKPCPGCNGRKGWESPDNGQWVSCMCVKNTLEI